MYTYEQAFKDSLNYFNGNELAANVFLSKYALKNQQNELVESNPDQMHWRLAKEFARIEKSKFKNPLTEQEIYNFFKNFEKIIPQGSPLYAIGNPYQYVSASNCFVVESPLDSYGGILKTDEELAQISKRRGGVGLDISNIRPNKSPTKNSSKTSTGIIPFMSRFSNTIREVGQDGRRGAEMLSISVHHPESVIPWEEEDGLFETEIDNPSLGKYKISSKYYNPNKLDFATAKYDPRKVTGANISIRLTDKFLQSLETNSTFEQYWPDTGTRIVEKLVNSKDCWEKIIYSAWRTGEPGLLFWDNILRESPADCYSKYGFNTISTNPCISGDSKIMTDNGEITITELVEKWKNEDSSINAVTYDEDNDKFEFSEITNAIKSKENANIIEIVFDDGTTIKLTPDHKVYTSNRGYVEAAQLTENDEIIYTD